MAAPDFQRVREIFHRVVEMSDVDRRAVLSKECGDDIELRTAVERLLRNHVPDEPMLDAELEKKPKSRSMATAAISRSGSGTKSFGATIAEESSGTSPGFLERSTQKFPQFYRDRWRVITAGIASLLLLMGVGAWCYDAIEKSVAGSLERTMHALLDEQVLAIDTWLAAEERMVRSWARSPVVLNAVKELDEIARETGDTRTSLQKAPALAELIAHLNSLSEGDDAWSLAAWNREGTLMADSSPGGENLLGNSTTEYGGAVMSRVFNNNETVAWMPSRNGFITQGFELPETIEKPGMALIVPVREGDQRPIAAVLLYSPRLQRQFEELLHKARLGDTGEAYAIGSDGFLISESRFMTDLKEANLVDDTPEAFSAQIVRVSDPGGNLLDDHSPTTAKSEWPLTEAAAAVTTQRDGGNFTGYRDYRGVDVIGVWKWLPRYRFGIIAELSRNEAYSALSPLVKSFSVILGALGLVGLLAILTSLALVRAKQDAGIGRVGPYTLKNLIGEGGFARVYLASHALLKRQTAVKILKPEQINQKNLARFEREVQLASSLTHPNTIGIYDYGSTVDGGFYYAMEYIKGVTLHELVEGDGPQPPERVVWILSQICRSLREAHTRGLIHRDIKPQNIMLCRHGGESDTVKVLDFGLARNLESANHNKVTETKLLIGTPLYIAPERILDPNCMDPRSDIYSVGILGYYLLTGHEPFEASDSIDALAQTMNRVARQPSEQSPFDIPNKLDHLICDCHSRATSQRPDTMDVVIDRLGLVPLKTQWNSHRAEEWWMNYRRRNSDGNTIEAGVATQEIRVG